MSTNWWIGKQNTSMEEGNIIPCQDSYVCSWDRLL